LITYILLQTLKLVSSYKGDEISLAFVPKPENYSINNFASAMVATVALYSQITPALALKEEIGAASPSKETNIVGGRPNSLKATGNQQPTADSLNSGGLTAQRNSPVRINPTAGFVIKTKDTDGNKVFINLCHHDTIPSHMPPSSNSLTQQLTAVMSLTRHVCFVFAATSVIPDRDGGDCIVIPCVVNSDTYQALDKHVPGEEITMYGGLLQFSTNGPFLYAGAQEYPQTVKFVISMIKRWNEENTQRLHLEEDKISFPKTKYGFKGDGDGMSSLLVTIPSPFSGLLSSGPSSSASPTAGGIGAAVQGVNPMLGLKIGKQMSSLLSVAASSAGQASSGRSSGQAPDSKLSGYSVTVAVVSSADLVDSHDHPFSLPDAQYIDNFGEFCVVPKPGFVINATKSNGQAMFINVCHHQSIGRLLPRDIEIHGQFVLCAVGVSTNHQTQQPYPPPPPSGSPGNHSRSLVLDVCIPSERHQLSDTGPEGKEDVRINIGSL
jgi:hypothetical protein